MKSLALKVLSLLIPLLFVSSCKASDALATPTATPTPSTTFVTPAAIPADHSGRTVCFICHQTGIAGVPKFPAGHAASADTLAFCQECHKPSPAATTPTTTITTPALPTSTPAPTRTSTPTSTATSTGTPQMTTTPVVTPTATPTTTTPASSGPPPIPADHAGRTTCLACHQTGIGGAPKLPASPDHSSFTDSFCAACHKGP